MLYFLLSVFIGALTTNYMAWGAAVPSGKSKMTFITTAPFCLDEAEKNALLEKITDITKGLEGPGSEMYFAELNDGNSLFVQSSFLPPAIAPKLFASYLMESEQANMSLEFTDAHFWFNELENRYKALAQKPPEIAVNINYGTEKL